MTELSGAVQPRDQRSADREGWVSILGNTLLFGLKFYTGVVSHSVALMADAVHTLSDSLSSVALLIGVRIARRPGDREHPFGHGRAELITTLLIGMMLGLVALEFAIGAIERLCRGEGGDYGQLAIWVTVFSIVAKEAMALYAFAVARKTGLRSVRADGWHHRSDAISSVVVLAGILLGGRWWWIDGVLGLAIAAILFQVSWSILRGAVMPLLGEEPSPELIEQVKAVCREAAPFPIEEHHFHLHQYGSHTELTFHLTIRQPGVSLEEAHRCTVTIERLLRDRYQIFATIHMEPENQ